MKKIDRNSEWFKILIIIVISLFVGALLFLVNNISGIFNILIFIIQTILGLIFGLWYFRIFKGYIHEIRKKENEKKVGVPKGWAIFGVLATLINFLTWGFFSALIFNIPKIFYLVPFIFALIQVSYTLHTANRRKLRDWLLLIYNVIVFIYLLNWTLVDFGVDMPNFVGVFSHTINSSVMWWQLININTGAYFSPTFMFPPFMANFRYYLAIPFEDYYKTKDQEYEEIEFLEKEEEEKTLIGERKPFFDERKRAREEKAEIIAIRKELANKQIDPDTKYAQYVASNDFSFNFRRLIGSFESIIRNFSLSIILMLIIITPLTFAGNISMNVIPNYQKQDYGLKPGMILAIKGNIFSTFDLNGNISADWEERLEEEINLLKDLHATHVRYDIKTQGLANLDTRGKLSLGLQKVTDEGIGLILSVAGGFIFTKKELVNTIYQDAKYIAETYKPEYMVIYNEINGELGTYLSEAVNYFDWLPEIANVSSEIKILNPATKVITSVLALKDGFTIYKELLTNISLNIDIVGVNFIPLLFGWRLNNLLQYGAIYKNTSTTLPFWITEIGMDSFNFGEDAQAKFLGKIISKSSLMTELDADGICITSLVDNIGITIERGITNHQGLVYYNDRKKKAFDAVSYGFGMILGVI
ncbi:MAG: hypothetical protein JXA54_02535 [Candidatus Heimdallarchaeota archaeon]|nr:hypothetical protein [Candidatus Heimdallarchaeota archaeon]